MLVGGVGVDEAATVCPTRWLLLLLLLLGTRTPNH